MPRSRSRRKRVSVAVIRIARRRAVVQGYAIEPLPAGAVVRVADRDQHRRPAGASSGAAARARSRWGAAAARGAGPARPGRAGLAGAVRSGAGPPRRSRAVDALAGQEGRAVPDRGGAASRSTPALERRMAAPSSSSSWRAATWCASTSRCARKSGMHAGLVDLATLACSTCSWRRSDPTGDWLVIHVQPSYTSRRDPARRATSSSSATVEGDGEAIADVVHQTTMYYQDRLTGQGFKRVLLGGMGKSAGRARPDAPDLVGTARRVVDMIDPTRAARADGSHHRLAGGAVESRPARGRHGAGARGSGERLMLHTNLSTRPFYNARAVQTHPRACWR